MVFFVDLCGAYQNIGQVREVAVWLDSRGQDVELHLHPEYLPKE